jgi:hypothetical protein
VERAGKRLKDFCKAYDFVLAPVVRDGDFNLDEELRMSDIRAGRRRQLQGFH